LSAINSVKLINDKICKLDGHSIGSYDDVIASNLAFSPERRWWAAFRVLILHLYRVSFY